MTIRLFSLTSFAVTAVLAALLIVPPALATEGDPLPSWTDGPNKTAILEFVDTVTTDGDAGFVPPEARIAVFDMDGTILVEKPEAAVVEFSRHYISSIATANPDLALQPYIAAREGDTDYLTANLFQLLVNAGINLDQAAYAEAVQHFAGSVDHPRFDRPFAGLFYEPMLEVIALLKARDFRVHIVSGSGQGFVRAMAGPATGLLPAQLIGTQATLQYLADRFIRGGTFRNLAVAGPGKPLIIEYQIGQRPIFAFGNTAGDQQLFEYTLGNQDHPALALWLDHDDDTREYAYDGHVTAVPGLRTVSMKADFARLFVDE